MKILKNISHTYRKTHNEGVFDAYTNEIRAARSAGLINWSSRCLW